MRGQLDRWQQAGLATCTRMLGRTWITPTSRGLTVAGLPYPVWLMPGTQLHHTHAVALVRLAVEANLAGRPGSDWVCERQLRLERGDRRWHLPDGVLRAEPSDDVVGPPRVIAIEVELTRKTRKRLWDEVLSQLMPGVALVNYVTTSELAVGLETDLSAVCLEHQIRTPIKVDVLPALDTLTV